MASRRPRAIFFDLDATLVYFNPDILVEKMKLVCAAMAQQHGVDAEALLRHHRRLTLDLWSRTETGLATGREASREIWREALSACGCEVEAAVMAASNMYWDNRHGVIGLFADSVPTLEALRGHFLLAVITNGPQDMQIDKLEIHGCDGHFDLFVASGELGFTKPDPRIFVHTCDKLGVAPEEAWHVGDNPAVDVAGAQAAGLTAVWLNRKGETLDASAPEPDFEIRSLTELPVLLDAVTS